MSPIFLIGKGWESKNAVAVDKKPIEPLEPLEPLEPIKPSRPTVRFRCAQFEPLIDKFNKKQLFINQKQF